MNDLTPVTREEIFLAKLGGQDVETPSPVTREELYLDILCGNSANVPAPFAREEIYLASLCGKNVQIPEPVTRKETFLAALCGEGILPPNPVTREEFFLEDWLDNNGEFLTVTGAIATFTTLRSAPLRSLAVTMKPKQDLHGYANPWPAGGGKNVLPTLTEAQTVNGVTATPNADGSITLTGAASAIAYFDLITGFDSTAYAGYIVTGLPDGMAGNSSTICYRISTDSSRASLQDIQRGASGAYVSNTIVDNGTNLVFSLRVNNGYALPNGGLTLYPMMRASSASADFAPYSNLCPISGWTGANVYHSGADTSDATTYSITFPSEAGTVYGGTVDLVSGLLTINRTTVNIMWGSGINATNLGHVTRKRFNLADPSKKYYTDAENDLKSNVIGRYDTLYSGDYVHMYLASTTHIWAYMPSDTAADTVMQFSYTLETPVTYQLTPTEVRALVGINNVWSDADGVTVTYRSN